MSPKEQKAYKKGRQEMIDEVVALIGGISVPDSLYYAGQAERIQGYDSALSRVMGKLETLQREENET